MSQPEINLTELVSQNPAAQNQPEPVNPQAQNPENHVEMPDANPPFLRTSSIAGHEETLYEAPVEIPQNMNYFVVDYIFVILGYDLLMKIVAGSLIIAAYTTTPLDWKPLALTMMIMHLVKIVIDVIFLVRYRQLLPEFSVVYAFSIMYSFSFIIVYLGIYLTLGKSMSLDGLIYIMYAHLMLMLVRSCFEPPMAGLLHPGGGMAFFEAIQLLIIVYKLGVTDGSVNWTWALLFFYIIGIALLIFAFFTSILLLIGAPLALFTDAFNQVPIAVRMAVGTALFYLSWLCILFYMVVSGFELLAVGNHLGFGTPKGTPDTRMRTAAYIMLICGILTLIPLIALYGAIKNLVLENLKKGRFREATLKSFAQDVNLDFTRVSENFFRPNNQVQGNAQAGDLEAGVAADNRPLNPDEGLCVICQEKKSDVMCMPCGHGGQCTECFKEYLKTKDECMLCRQKIEKVFIGITEDPNTHKLQAKGAIKIKR